MTRYLPLLIFLLLAACGGLSQPFGKVESRAPAPSITAPPWEAMVAAGPGAANDIDLETLNGPAKPAPEVAAAETPIAPPTDEPRATGAEITAVAVVAVTGARGGGNDELTKAMRQTLAKAGWTVLNAPAKNALTIAGHVVMAAPSGPEQKISLRWDVTTPDGKNLGDVKQANNVPAGSLDGGWGENAGFAAEAAATGIFELINKFR
jgi:hypothetical protein